MCSNAQDPDHIAALALWEEGSRLQMAQDLDAAERLYRRSLALHPTAEAWTFLGWLLSWRGDIERAIEYCRRAIEVDPGYGNPYNDIGAYLIEQGRFEEAIPWLRRAIEAPRYEARVFPWVNLGRAFELLGQFKEAIAHYRRALEIAPGYQPALLALERLVARRNGQVKLET